MSTYRSRIAAPFLFIIGSMLALAGCAGQSPTGNVATPPATATVNSVTPTPTANPVFSSFVGKWVTHDDQLTIAANSTGVETWNAGPCIGQGTSGMCAGIGDLTFTVNPDGSLTGSYQSVSYESNGGQLPSTYQPPAGYPVVGNTITLKHNGADLLTAAVNGNNFNYCDPTALGQGLCGA